MDASPALGVRLSIADPGEHPDFLDLPLEETLRMASLYPAQALGVAGERGALKRGLRADLVLLSEDLQVNQTIQFYRTQQGGGAPVRVYLCGGGSLLPYASQFFEEKLSLPVEFFNPFRNVQIDPSVDVSQLESVAPQFAEVIGLGLRNVAQCPVELNLMPRASLNRQQFNAKKPFLIAAAYAAVLGVFAVGWFFSKVADVRRDGVAKIDEQLQPLEATKSRLESAEDRLKKVTEEANQIGSWIEDRLAWVQIVGQLGGILKSTETESRDRLGVPVGIWIDTLISTEPTKDLVQEEETDTASSGASFYRMSPELAKRYGLIPRGDAGGEGGGEAAEAKPKAKAATNNTNEIAVINLTIRAVNLNARANGEIAYAVEKAMKGSPLFDEKDTQLSGTLEQVAENAPSFSFPLKVKLKRPIKL